MSNSWDFLICIKFCETIESSSLAPALRGWFVYKVSRSPKFTSLRKLVLLSFYRLSNLEFDSMIRFGNRFNCLLLLMHVCLKIESLLRKTEGNLGHSQSLTRILN